jgi:hypothetical protein
VQDLLTDDVVSDRCQQLYSALQPPSGPE